MRMLRIIPILIMFYGLLAFTGWGMTILDQIPYFSPVEWPLGTVSGVVQDSRGRYVAANTAYSRVQVYDQDLNFITGWSVDDGGGNFYLLMNKDDQVEVLCARNSMHYVYGLDGTLISSGNYNSNDYPHLGAESMKVTFPTPLYLLPCSSPALGWLTGLIGFISLAVVNRLIGGKEEKQEG